METRPAKHPTAEILQAFGLGKLDDSSSGALLAHLDLCVDCRKIVASQSGDDFLDRLRQAHSRNVIPAPPKSLGGMEGRPKSPPVPTTLFNLPPELADNPQYDILKELGRGGMGVVYLAKNKLMDRLEVLKVINKALLDRPGAVERFLREIRAAAKLNHVNVVVAYSALQLGDLLVFAMEYVDGQDLAAVVKANGPLPVPHACFYVQQAAQGLQHAFEKKMVHRDIKPQNLILAREGRKHLVKVLDFGLAKVMRETPDETDLTGEGKMLGTPDYMAPEQTLDATSADIRADIYSLGCTLYFLLSGSRPFKGKNLFEIMQAHQSLEATALNVARPEVPAELAAVVRKMMAKERAERYQTPLEVAQALSPFLKQEERPISPPTMLASPSLVVWHSLTDSVLAATRPYQSNTERGARKRWLIGGAVAASLLLLGLMSYWLAGVLFRVETSQGTLVVEINDDEVEARFQKGKLILTGLDGKVHYTLMPSERNKELDEGPYQIRVEGADGLIVDTTQFTLTKGSKVTVQVRLESKAVPPAVAAVPADALRRSDIPEAVLASLGGGDPKRAPPELVAVLGEGRFRLTGIAYSPAFSLDGTLLAVPSGSEVLLFDANSGQMLRHFRGRTGRIGSVVFSPNGAVLAMGDAEMVRLWDPRSGALLQELSGHAPSWIEGLAFTPDGNTLLFCSDEETLHVRDVATGRRIHVLSCKGQGRSLAITPDGRLAVAATRDGRVYGWSLDTGAQQFVLEVGEQSLPKWAYVSVSADGQWLASGTNAKVQVWKIADLTKKDPAPIFEKQTPACWVQFEKNSNNLWTAEHIQPRTDYRACCWNPQSGQLVSSVSLRRTAPPYLVCALSPDDRTLAAFSEYERLVQFYDTRTGKPRFADPGHTREIYSVAFSPDGRWLASGGIDGEVRVWDLATASPRHNLKQHTREVESVAFSPDSKRLASGSFDGTIALWDLTSSARIGLLRGHHGESQVRFSPDGIFVAAGTAAGGVRLWFARNGEEAKVLSNLHEGRVRCLAFRADGQRLATGGQDGKVVISDPANGKVLQVFQRKTEVFSVDFGADGETVAAGYVLPEPVARLWNLKNKDFVSLKGHFERVTRVALRCDGRLAVTTSDDGTVRLWEVGGNQPRKMVLGLGSVGEKLWTGALSLDWRYLATGNSNGTIYLFRLPAATENVGEWLAARSTPPPGLSHEAWLERVKGLTVGNTLGAVSDRLRERNLGFVGQVSPVIEDGAVTGLTFLTDNVTDLSPLRALTGLRNLSVHGSGDWRRGNGKLADLSPLTNMKLESLACYCTSVSDLTPLKGMKLRSLYCNVTKVSDLTPLKDMPLTELICHDTKVRDLSPLKGMKLRNVNFSGSPVADLSPLIGMELTSLDLQRTRVSDLSPLKDMKLMGLYCWGTPLADLSPLKHMKLTSLDCGATQVSDLSPLKDMKLVGLTCTFSPVTDDGLLPLREMTSLRWLALGGTKMTDTGLEHLKKLSDLESLCCGRTKLTGAGLAHLKGMTKLRHLELMNTEVDDAGLVHLKGLLGLRELHLDHTRVTDAGLEHLAGMKKLERLFLNGTAVTVEGVAKLKAALPKCNIIR